MKLPYTFQCQGALPKKATVESRACFSVLNKLANTPLYCCFFGKGIPYIHWPGQSDTQPTCTYFCVNSIVVQELYAERGLPIAFLVLM